MRSSFVNARRSFLFVAAGALAVASSAVFAQSDSDKFPNKPIEVVIHSKYGGGTDTTARMMMIRTRRELGVDMSVVSKRGGSGAKAHQYAMSKPRDGYTVLALTQSHLYTIARGKSPLTIDDLVEASKKEPLNWGVAQIGGTEHIGLAQLAKAAGMKFKVVPFGSGAQMVQALMSGAIDATLPNVSEGGPQVRDGTFRALAVMAEKRLKDYPEVPTTYENGYEVKTSTTRGYWVLKGTPQDRIDALSEAMVKAMNHDVFANYLKTSGLTPEDSVAGHEVWDKHIKEEYQKAYEALKELDLLDK